MKSIIEPKEHHVFQKYNRTFTWNLKPPIPKAVRLIFNWPGLKQIQPTDSCPDKHVYMITVANISVGRFCHNGHIREFDVQNFGKLSLEVSGGQPLEMEVYTVSLECGLACKCNDKAYIFKHKLSKQSCPM